MLELVGGRRSDLALRRSDQRSGHVLTLAHGVAPAAPQAEVAGIELGPLDDRQLGLLSRPAAVLERDPSRR